MEICSEPLTGRFRNRKRRAGSTNACTALLYARTEMEVDCPGAAGDYAGDRIFLAVPSAGPDASEAQQLMDTPIWRNLPAVKSGRAHTLDLRLANYNPLTLDAHLEAVGGLLL
ncbi:hypothetical protein [Paenibacillus tepidiphilus]|uniref:hypothetical protein n=1 Tax=Paenibacillus tepidiphilus TaxID=2608683 RepID=UPI00123C3C11|nr:hypothetical protein [Paenibacillus tepidiphilus]